jgi:hypothetical protein
MSLSANPKFDTNTYLNVYDGGSASIIRIPYVDKDVKISGLMKVCNAVQRADARGGFLGVGYGDPTVPTITLSEEITDLIAASAPGPLRDFLTQTGSYVNNVSTLGSGHMYTVHLEQVTKGAALGDSDMTRKLWNVLFDKYDYANGGPNKHAWTGQILGVPGFWGGSVGGAGTIVSLNGLIECRRIDQDGY